MIKVNIKPLSINESWQGRRFKTKKYKSYRQALMYLLPLDGAGPAMISKADRLELSIEWGFSNKQSDIDNCAKGFIDGLQDRYEFNDSQIYKLIMTKEIVKKGDEYIKFEIKQLKDKS
jgi:Holliday junction resolvase RusA-like endonuclease